MRKKGFTLVELLAVIVLLGLLMAIAVPSALNLSSKVKSKSYDTKIDLIEKAAETYGQSNISFVKTGTDLKNQNDHYTCKFNYKDDEVSSVVHSKKAMYSENTNLADNEFWCIQVSIEDLVESNNLDYDEKDVCNENEKCTSETQKQYYNNIVINPKNNNIINKCYVYIYYKYKRVYAYFDVNLCNSTTSEPSNGYEYRPL